MSVQRMKLFNFIPLINNHLFGTCFVPVFPLGGWGSSLLGSLRPPLAHAPARPLPARQPVGKHTPPSASVHPLLG